MTHTYLFIDLGYFLHFRFYAARSWYYRANQGKEVNDSIMQQDTNFQSTLKKRVFQTIEKLQKKYGVPWESVIYCRDCRQTDIWRNQLVNNYKETRPKNRDVKLGFQTIYQEIEEMVGKGKGRLISHPQAEADDIVYTLRNHLKMNHQDASFIIIASDHDYYQLCGPDTLLVRLDSRPAMNKSLGNPKKDLLYKIILGDTSDNIPGVFPKCGMKTTMKLVENPELLKKRLLESTSFQERYRLNQSLIDMGYIPENIQREILQTYKDIHQPCMTT